MNLTRKQYLLIGIVIILLVLAFIFYSVYKKDKNPLYEQITVNKDTGQTIINMPNQQPEKGGGNNYVTILGTNKFLTAGMTEAQFTLAQQLITKYVNNQLGRKYTQVAILNDGFLSTGTEISAQMRLGTSSKLLNLNIKYHDLVYVEVMISDPAGSLYYKYDSGDQMAPNNS